MKLAPHGKTTMCPELFKIQLDQGAWGMTLANTHQVQVAHDHGVKSDGKSTRQQTKYPPHCSTNDR